AIRVRIPEHGELPPPDTIPLHPSTAGCRTPVLMLTARSTSKSRYDTTTPAEPVDVSTLFAAGWAWAAGGVVSTPADTLRFVRSYVRGDGFDQRSRRAQFRFRPGSSEPPGPGINSAGLALFRYDTEYGRVFGHTGNTSGYTQFAAATEDGACGVVVTATTQLSPGRDARTDALFAKLRAVYERAVGTALV
ncbi:serine hydrolase, partial [Tomitella gaofuii]|uniref:serine hydrolase n=1 Tax=Tomitella gaofuii TaxID=2760083 RepID=UPI0015FD3386